MGEEYRYLFQSSTHSLVFGVQIPLSSAQEKAELYEDLDELLSR